MKHEEGNDEFQQFKQQYLTYSLASQATHNFHDTRKNNVSKTNEKQKLKIIPQTEYSLNLATQLQKANKQKRLHSYSGKIIGVGDAIFRSNFQSGNINEVRKLSPHHYQVTLQRQTSSNRISAWFYFACQGLKGQIKFTIKGFTKSRSLYNEGMKVCYRELCEGSKWRRGCSKINYEYMDSDLEGERGSYCLNFTFFFKNQYPNSVQFAYCFPYTYTHLLNFLSENSPKLHLSTLGTTFQGRQIPLVSIGNGESNKVIVISSRVHPGQTVASLMMHGFMKELMGKSLYSQILRENFDFKLVPMINPDGVFHGNYRFSGAGYDLNRKWKVCKKQIYSEVYYLKQMIKEISKTKEVLMYIDLHGHSRQKNVFFYGCCPKDRQDIDQIKPKQFPFLMSKMHSGFRFDYSCYTVQKEKEGTARIAMWKHLKIPYVYTLQASFMGTDKSNYSFSDYESVGASLCQGICLNFWMYCEDKQEELKQEFDKKMRQFYENPKLLQFDCSGNSSDSEPEAGQIPDTLRKQWRKMSKTRKNYYNSMKIQEKSIKNRSFLQLNSQKAVRITNKNKIISVNKKNDIKRETSSDFSMKREKAEGSSFLKTEYCDIPLDAEEKLKNLFANKRFISQFQDKRTITRFEENKDKLNAKKKTVSFQGAQYRRVRKMVEENNKVGTQGAEKEKDIVVGLPSNNFKEIEKISIKHKAGSLFPSTQIKYKKGNSLESKFRRQKMYQQTMEQKKSFIGLGDMQVRCTGKQIF